MSTALENKKRKQSPGLNGSTDESKKPKMSETKEEDAQTFGQLTADKIKELMANAQKQIQERKTQLSRLDPGLAAKLSMPHQQHNHLASRQLTQQQLEATEKLKKAAELQKSIQAKLSSVGMAIAPAVAAAVNANQPTSTSAAATAAGPGPTPLILDEFGRTIDAKTGQPIQLQSIAPTLKANIRAKKREQFRAVQEKSTSDEVSEGSRYFDFRLDIKPHSRNRKSFKFFEPGKFQKMGQKIRTKAALEKLQSEISQAAKKTGIATAAKLAIIQPKKENDEETPGVEWWDSVILQNDFEYPQMILDLIKQNTSSSVSLLLSIFEGITHLVEHPIQIKPPGDNGKTANLPVMLTKEERKKLRRQTRNEALKEQQEKIRLGLVAPPEPKVRMANLMRVLGSEAVQDPTKVEAHVRSQMAKRQKAHEDMNQARKLTKTQRREKKLRKIREDLSSGVLVAVYRVMDLSNPSHKFKVETNANQLLMTGIVILHKDCNVVVVEGGPKQQNKFKRLMLHRIKWDKDGKKNRANQNNEKDDEDDEDEEKKNNQCRLVWEGSVKSRNFKEIKLKLCPTEAFAREQLRKHSCEHYWDLAFSSSILESTTNNNIDI